MPAIRFALAIASRCPGNAFWNSHALTMGHRCGNRIVCNVTRYFVDGVIV